MKVKKKQQQSQQQQHQQPTVAQPELAERPQQREVSSSPTTTTATDTPAASVGGTVTTPVKCSLEKVNFDNRIKRKNVLALNEKVAAIKEYDKTPVYKHVGRLFNCSPDQIKRIVQQRDTILKAWEQRTRRCQDAKTLEMKVVRVSMLGKAVYDWIRRMMYYKDFIITDGLIQKMALQFKSAMGLQNFFPHQEWCDKFRVTYHINNNDTKQLKIGYSQGYSVQIKDIIKDVLTECTPETAAGIDDEDDRMGNCKSDQDDDDTENKDEDVDIDGDGSDSEEDIKPDIHLINSKLSLTSTTAKPLLPTLTPLSPSQLQARVLPPPLQPLHQLLALPIKTNAPPGTTQKVLVATPISAPGGGAPRRDAPPMTMTIIPLAQLTQSVQQTQQQQQHQQLQLQQAAKKSAQEKQSTVPPPILDIKKEIKEEPKDAVDENAEPEADAPPVIRIKQEIVSDDEADSNQIMNEPQPEVNLAAVSATLNSITSKQQEKEEQPVLPPEPPAPMTVLATEPVSQQTTLTTISTPLPTASPIPPTPAASSPKQRMRKTRGNRSNSSNEKKPTESSPAKKLALGVNLPTDLPSPPPLKKAPTHATRAAAKKRIILNNNNKRHNNNNNSNNNKNNSKNNTSQSQPAIKSCAEARNYLKLLEDYALYNENYRLIGLITRADEVLRELDDERDQDIDID